MRTRATSAALAALIAMALPAGAGCDGTPGGPLPVTTVRSAKVRIEKPTVLPGDAAVLAADNAAFALALYAALSAQPGNLVLSPASVSVAMAMTSAGARTQTAAQLATTLHFTLPAARLHPAFNALTQALATRATLALTNDLWVDQRQQLQAAFLDTLAENYGAGVRLVDFMGAPEPARLTINRWVAEQTAGRVADLLPPGIIAPDVRLVLTNAVYLNADWQTPFTEPTMNHPFHRADGTEVSVPMMLGKAGIAMATGSGYRAAELAYAGGALSMVVIVPDAGTFATFEGDLNADRLAAILDALIVSPIGLLLPRFQFSLAISLRDTLSAMGMPLAFTPDAADLSGIDGARDLFIRDVVEKTFIAVTERGTEAAGASGVVVATKSADPLLTVDRPFLFLIRDRPTGTLLFLGRVVDPTPSP